MDKWFELKKREDEGSQATDEMDALDTQIDQALRSYSRVESRPGMEERLLASLQAEQASRPRQSLHPWNWATAGWIAAAAMALLWFSSTRLPPTRPATLTSHLAQPQPQPLQLAQQQLSTANPGEKRAHRRTAESRSNTHAESAGFAPIVFAPIHIATLN
ncbi:hypothetical protein ACOBR2_07295 [Telmatobacter bradus]|uniref:hypothetical protein n=1 Tax=Telmatobacter bradus TaxID=474953 RepID=UPI003B42887C